MKCLSAVLQITILAVITSPALAQESEELSIIIDPPFGVVPFETNFELLGDTTGLEVYWDFGDGDIDEGVYVYHVYKEPGSFDAKLTLVASDGTSTETPLIVSVFPYVDLNKAVGNGRRAINYSESGGQITLAAGKPIEGFSYYWDYADYKTPEDKLYVQGANVSIDPGLGTYTFGITIVDDRTNMQIRFPRGR